MDSESDDASLWHPNYCVIYFKLLSPVDKNPDFLKFYRFVPPEGKPKGLYNYLRI